MSTEPGHLLLVPETRPGHGLGHLQRSIALGEAWADAGGSVSVMVDPDVAEAAARVQRAGLDLLPLPGEPAHETTVLRAAADAQWCVFDGYEHGADLHAATMAVTNVAIIDDDGRSAAGAVDVAIDHNPGADATRYDEVAPVVLAGSDYTLLGRSHRAEPTATEGDRLVVVMGGQPSPEVVRFTHDVVAGLTLPLDSVDLVGVVGVGASRDVRRIGADDPLAPVFGQARVGLSAAGSTTWELAAAGVPTVLVAVADNQMPVGSAAGQAGVSRFLGAVTDLAPGAVASAVDGLWNDASVREEMARRARALIDGRGPERVVQGLLVSPGRR